MSPTDMTSSESDPKYWHIIETSDGRVYYHNDITGSNVWDKPNCLKSATEQIPIDPWREYQAANGRTYYHNTQTNETTWKIPKEVVSKREKGTKNEPQSQRQSKTSNTSIQSDSSAKSILVENPPKRSLIKNPLANGYGNYYNWITLTEALHLAKIENRPIMLIIHKSWCGACKLLAPKFAHCKEIQELSEQFFLVNACDDDEPKATDNKYAPDGRYNPRILFYDFSGNLMKDILCDEDSPYKYFYTDEDQIVHSMKMCLRQLRRKS